jgi:hypothetical protein
MNAKRQTMKPVKAWAIVNAKGLLVANHAAAVDGGRILAYRADYQAREALRDEPPESRIVRVEIRSLTSEESR